MTAAQPIQVVNGAQQAAALLHPLRLRLLEHLAEPASAARLARQLATPRQKINYHLRELEKSGLVRFVEERRRAKVLPRFRGEKECLKLVFATLWRSSERWKKVKFTKLEREELERYIKARRADGFEVRHLAVAA